MLTRYGGTQRLTVVVLFFTFILTGCASTKEEIQVSPKPQRQDLYQGQSQVALGDSVPLSEQDALNRATDAERAGDLDKALYAYIQALDFNQNNADTFYQIARINLAKGNQDIAFKAYNEALIIAPEHRLANAELGILEIDQRQYTLARKHLEKTVKLDQQRLAELKATSVNAGFIALDELSPLRVYNALGILEDLENYHQMARTYFLLVLAFQPKSPVIATNLGYSFYLIGDFEKAEAYLKQALRADPSFDRAWSNLGLVYIRKGLYRKALASFEQTMSTADALNDLGYFLMLEGKYEQAITMFKQAIDSSPTYFERAQKNLKIALASKIN
ncbi:tetratricopeptide repeat protein [Shewanella sp. JBTF-M18]|uniref:Tetratricopeptide repeat protein n=1 Tax=Shewanella insulae TaxID=2681496 RepID=A0A6L7HXV6_9GAMM|nr:tetratricopeptide repeat protein [Shewanella insulae]MXR69172.1 tetratricopeptide repeat protein [Shewanella insulae]